MPDAPAHAQARWGRARGFLARTLLLLAAAWLPPATVVADETALWQALRAGGRVVLMRHALAPGMGDPPEFRLDDCATQRNLSDEGRAQARRIGEALRANGVAVDAVLSSRWCRCTETAALLGVGEPEAAPVLDSFFQDRSTEEAQTEATRELIAGWRGDGGNLVLVTHQVNITALTGVYPAVGEMVVLEPGGADGPDVLGSLAPR